jgi:tRNA A-37 threonylcarbamoyl transferase component Bud32
MNPPGRLLASGREADVFDMGGGWVLRRYRDHEGAEREAATIEHVRRHGFPAPAVREAGGRDIVMERIDGPSMLDALIRRPWTLWRHARLLADLHGRLHAIPWPAGLPAPFGDGPATLHMDLHPANVLLSARGPVVIDWAAACQGRPEEDVAQAWIILATSVIPTLGWRLPAVAVLRRAFLREFLGRFDRTAVARVLPAVAAERMKDPHVLDAERRSIQRLLGRAAAVPPPA